MGTKEEKENKKLKIERELFIITLAVSLKRKIWQPV